MPDSETWEKVLLAVLGGAGGFLGGLFSKLLMMVFPPYNQLVEEVKSLRTEIREERADNERLRERIAALEDTLEDEEDNDTRGHRTMLGL